MIDCKRYKPMDCPVCGEFYFSELDESDVEIYDNLQCPQCGWIYDLEQVEDPKATTSLNGTSLTDYREKYKALIKENPEYNYCDDHYEAVPHACPVCGRHTFPDEGSFEICPICGWQDDNVMEKVNIISKLTDRTPEEVVNDTLWDNLRKIEDVPVEFDGDKLWEMLDHDNPEGDDILDELSKVNQLMRD